MDFITQKRFLIGLVIGLSLFNFLSLSLLLYREFASRSPHHESFKPEEPRNMAVMLEKELNFDQDQIDRFRELRREFRHKADQNRTALEKLRKQVMSEALNDSPNNEKIDNLAGQIGQLEINKTTLITHHFQKIKALCRPDQMENFNILLKNLSRQLSPLPPGPPFHQRNREMPPVPNP